MVFWDSIIQIIRSIAAAKATSSPTPQVPVQPEVSPGPTVPTVQALPDRQADFIIPDVYPGDLGLRPPFEALPNKIVNGKEVIGCYIKATEGTSWGAANEAWFQANWPRLRALANDSFFAGVYHFLRFQVDGARQADYLCDQIAKAGGLGDWAFMVWVDVEEGGQGTWANDPKTGAARKLEDIKIGSERARLSAEIRKCVTDFIRQFKVRTGLRCGVYGRGVMRDLQMTDCDWGDGYCNPAYIKDMPSMAQYGVPLDRIVEFQYCGDGVAELPGFPKSIPGWGATDISTYVDGANKTTLSSLRKRALSK